MRRIRVAHSSLQAELHELRESVPLLVRSIWGAHCDAVVTTMRRRQASVARLLRDWQDAEHRLIAVANSLTSLQTGQKLVAVGAPLAAAHLMGGAAPAQCYAVPAARRPAIAETSLTLGAINTIVARAAEEIALIQRGVFLFLLFLPMIVTSPVLLLGDRHRDSWLRLMLWTLERAGPAFIKWGQWAATRPDLFAPDVCESLAKLQTEAPTHSFYHTRATVEAALGRPLESVFSSFEEAPVASGSIAQVHRAVLTPEGAAMALEGSELAGSGLLGGLLPLPAQRTARRAAATFADGATVAVKVRHPGVTELMEKDFALMRRAATVAGALPGGSGPQLKESLMQFGAPMREQLDLRTEAAHLARFAEDFKWWSSVKFPLPAGPPLVAPDLLVESFEPGEHISKYLNTEGEHNRRLADLGMNCYMQMLLTTNRIHADLHPGNILVQTGADRKSVEGGNGAEAGSKGGIFARLKAAVGLDISLPRLVLLDVGMTLQLSPEDQRNLVGFFSSLAAMDGAALAEAILSFTESATPDPRGFKSDMAALFETLSPDYMRENSQQVIGWMMDTIREHQVHMKGVVSSVVFSSMVLEGWSSKLNPDIRIVETLKEKLPGMHAWKARVLASVDRVVAGQGAAALVG